MQAAEHRVGEHLTGGWRITKAEAAAKVQQTLDLGERYRK